MSMTSKLNQVFGGRIITLISLYLSINCMHWSCFSF